MGTMTNDARWMLPRFNRYLVANRGWRVMWNEYDYRPEGGSRYRVGVAAVLGRYCYGVVWARPGTDFGRGSDEGQ